MGESEEQSHARVLIVEDSAEYAQVLKRMLGTTLGINDVTVVDNPEEAFATIESDPGRYEMLFVDYHFPSTMTGGQLMSKLKAQGWLKNKVAFFMTAEPDVEKAIEATTHGISGIVVKPFDRDQLRLQVQRAERDLHMARVSYGDD